MPEIKVYDISGAVVSTLELSERVFDAPENQSLVHQAVVTYQANQRQGTVNTLTRGEVSGGGGSRTARRARAAPARAAPAPRTGSAAAWSSGRSRASGGMRMPQKMRQGALRCVLSDKVRRDRIRVLDSLRHGDAAHAGDGRSCSRPWTCAVRCWWCSMSATRPWCSRCATFPDVQMVPAAILNTYDVISADWLLTTAATMRMIEEKLG